MDMSTDKAVTECFHGISKNISAYGLNDIFDKFGTIAFDSFPLFSVAGSFVGNRLATELVWFDLGLYIGEPPAGRKLNKQHSLSVVEFNAMGQSEIINIRRKISDHRAILIKGE